MIKTASYSKLLDFERCKYAAKLKHIDRIPEEKSEAADRGTVIHQLAEDYVRGKLKQLPRELAKFEAEFEALRARYKAGQVSLEGEWGFDRDWQPCDWKNAWLRIKADGVVHLTRRRGVVIDYKTGKRFGNEIKHGEQVQLYAIGALLREPSLEEILVELWYLDINDLVSVHYTRNQALRYMQSFEKRLVKLTSATEFPPNPNIFSCKWCAYGPAKGNQCEYSVLAGESHVQNYRRKFG